jgi:hypothetical protein
MTGDVEAVMKNVVVFGAGTMGKLLYGSIKGLQRVMFFVDNASTETHYENIPILHPVSLKECDFDYVYVASATGLESIYVQLTDHLHIPSEKIIRLFSEYWLEENHRYFETGGGGPIARVKFLETFAMYAYMHSIEGAVAEVGVFRGDFAKEINRVFHDRRCYLFDTFEGFDEHDLKIDETVNANFILSEGWRNEIDCHFKANNADEVLSKMPNPQLCTIKKGYFPETFDLGDEKFCFVNLDTDLYSPIKAGLEVFWGNMARGGVILIHDYFGSLSGVRIAVDSFCDELQIHPIPIGDALSAAIVKS